MNSQVTHIIRRAWDKNTCFPASRKDWNQFKPELGQCAVTALLIQDIYGGVIAYNSAKNHFWNILPNGKKLDLTRGQFECKRLKVDAIVNREELLFSSEALKQNTFKRYSILKRRVKSYFEKRQTLVPFIQEVELQR